MRRILEHLKKHPCIVELMDTLHCGARVVQVEGVRSSGWGVCAATLADISNRTSVLIAPSREHAERIYEDIRLYWSSAGATPDSHPRLYRFPVQTEAFIGYGGEGVTARERIAALLAIHQRSDAVIVTSIEAIARPTVSPDAFEHCCFDLRCGDVIPIDALTGRLIAGGYETSTEVQLPGEFSRRGGIVDVFSPSCDLPVRIEFFGDEIESMRLFDPATQRSVETIERCTITPAREFIIPSDHKRLVEAVHTALANQADQLRANGKVEVARLLIEQVNADLERLMRGEYFDGAGWYACFAQTGLHYLLDHLPQDAVIIWFEPHECELHHEELHRCWKETLEAMVDSGDALMPPNLPWMTWDELKGKSAKFAQVICALEIQDGYIERDKAHSKIDARFALNIHHVESFQSQLPRLMGRLAEWTERRFTVVLATQYPERVGEMLEEFLDGQPRRITCLRADPTTPLNPGVVTILNATPSRGFIIPDASLAVISDVELFGRPLTKRVRRRFKYAVPIASPNELRAGDYVVHVQHGIGIYRGVVRQKMLGAEADYLLIEYAGGDLLYVPVTQIDRVQRYVGADGTEPSLSSLSSRRWLRARQRAKRGAEELARELIELHAIRHAGNGFAFSKDSLWQVEMEAAFPYEETEDQWRAIEEVKRDMEAHKPMDRLICGDVGFGKTEVAIRAAFKAVQDSKQVAVLVPTTVLAQQHYNTFRQRLAPYPVNIAMLSRFLSPTEQQRVLEGLRVGSVDIVIGTHRLLSDDVSFRDLGLLIIDEEQRFGVRQKEKLKKLRATVDILTLTATPIPRTLHIALGGLKEISIINDPPAGRRPVRTFLMQYSDDIVRHAILRELERDGQVYYVYNRVRGINHIAEKVKRLVPQARVAVAHGQLPEERLERVMLDFYEHRYDVLVCTTIIENGLDVPNVNTLIVEKCEQFGLAQLYQLRGRVGRSDRQAYAYFFHDHPRRLTPMARHRLEALREFSDLGSGFRLALRDLEIRGAGNLLGVEQHGFISEVGFDLYMKMLSEAIHKLKGEPLPEPVKLPEADLPVRAFIPEDYIPDEMQRLNMYRKMAGVQTEGDVDNIKAELCDRFGQLPPETENLISVLRIRTRAYRAHIAYIAHDRKFVSAKFYGARQLSDVELVRIYSQMREDFSMETLNAVRFYRDHVSIEYGLLTERMMLKLLERLLEVLSEHPPTVPQFK